MFYKISKEYYVIGSGVLLHASFLHKTEKVEAFKPKFKINQNPYQLVTSLEEQLEKLKERTLVGLDPGKGVLAMLVDKKGKTVKYTSSQRRYESFQKNAKYVRDRLKTINKLQETEKVLADYDTRTMNVEKFKDFIRVKMVVMNKVKKHYDQIIYRKLRLRTFVEGKKSVDKFLKRIEDAYGPNPLIGYGNWSRSSQMKFQAPTMGRGLRRQIHQRFETLTIDEFGSSKYCHKCEKELKNLEKRDGKKVHRCLVCEGCQCSESDKGVFRYVQRDINGALNILKCLEEWIKTRTRPVGLRRTSNNDSKEYELNVKMSSLEPSVEKDG
jgi:hypothetical protein